MLRANLLTLIFLFGISVSFTIAQDVIYLTDGRSINAQVQRVNLEDDYVYFNEPKEPGVQSSISMDYVSSIRFGFGYTRKFSPRGAQMNPNGVSRGGDVTVHRYGGDTHRTAKSPTHRYANLRVQSRIRNVSTRSVKPNSRITLVDGTVIMGDFDRITDNHLWYKPEGLSYANSRSITLDLIASVKLINGTHLSVSNKYLSILRNEGIKWANGQTTIAKNIELREDKVRYYRKNADLAQLYDLESVYKVLLKDHVITVSF